MAVDAFDVLSGSLGAWLRESLASLESAYRAGRLGHAWLIAGPRGAGKLNLALVFADRLLRAGVGAPPPPELSPTRALEAMRERHEPQDHHADLHWLFPEADKQSIGIEQVRDVTDALALKAFKGGAKVLVIEPAEAMTPAAANALLKSLEEPHAETYMLLVSHQPGRLPATIRSRCQTLSVRGRARARDASDAASLPPLRLAYERTEEYTLFSNKLYNSLNLIYESKRDPLAVADEWLEEDDLGAILEWLAGRISAVLRSRIGGRHSNPITEPRGTVLHNDWPALKLSTLFDQLAAAERLRGQLGGGLNAELALRVLLMGFVPERGRL